MRHAVTLGLVLILVVSCKSDDKSAELPSVKDEMVSTVTATVEAIDVPSRWVTLRGPEGNTLTFRASEQVRNLSQVKVGDRVTVTYYESVAAQVRRPTDPINQTEIEAARAPEGTLPGAYASEATTVTTTIEAIDHSAPAVTLKGPQGRTVTVRVRNPDNLKNVKVGDQVVITYTEGMAVAVERAE